MKNEIRQPMAALNPVAAFSFACLLLVASGCQSNYERGYAKGERDASGFSADCAGTLVSQGYGSFKKRLKNTAPKTWPEESREYNEGYKSGWNDYIKYLEEKL